MEWCRVYGQPDDAPWYKIVDFETASRNGELWNSTGGDWDANPSPYNNSSLPVGGRGELLP
ncbi:hypothetical protein D3C77_611810 [compost metagenome]